MVIVMASYQLFTIRENTSLDTFFQSSVLENTKTDDDDPRTLKTFVDYSKNHHRNIVFTTIKRDMITKLNLEQKMFLDSNDQEVWLDQEKLIIRVTNHLLIGKTRNKFEKLLGYYLRDKAEAAPAEFSNKFLWQLWNSLSRNSTNLGLKLRLHRVIMYKTLFESDNIKEINLQANNISDLLIIKDLVKHAEKINVITIKIQGLFENSKWITIRIDRKGSFLVYGKHPPEILLDVFRFILDSI
jgi:hypothetical protein